MHKKDAKNKLNGLFEKQKSKNISLICGCQKETLCHKSIIGGLFQGLKCEVKCERDYSNYYELYKKAKNTQCIYVK